MLTIYHFVIFYIHSDDGKDLWNAIDNAIQCDKQYQYKIGREDFIIKHLEMSKIDVSELSEESYRYETNREEFIETHRVMNKRVNDLKAQYRNSGFYSH